MCFASEWNHNFRGSTRMCSVCSCEKRSRAPMWATSGWCLFQSQYFLVLIHSRVPVVHQCGQPRTGAHGVLICQDVTSSGPEGKRKGGWGEGLDGEKERWHPHACTHAPVQKHAYSMSVSQSVNVHLRDSTSALYIPKDISTQLTESTGSAPRHTRTVQLGACGLRRAAGEDDLLYKSSRSTKVSLWYLSFRLASAALLYTCIILPSYISWRVHSACTVTLKLNLHISVYQCWCCQLGFLW